MAGTSPSARGTGRAGQPAEAAGPKIEQPTQAAELRFAVGPASAGGTVPPGDTHHFITTFGIAGSVAAGIAGAVLTLRLASGVTALRVGSGLTVLALAELGLGLLGAVLIAVCSRWTDQAARSKPETEMRSADFQPVRPGSARAEPDVRKNGQAGFPWYPDP
jgi:hypothetical protein